MSVLTPFTRTALLALGLSLAAAVWAAPGASASVAATDAAAAAASSGTAAAASSVTPAASASAATSAPPASASTAASAPPASASTAASAPPASASASASKPAPKQTDAGKPVAELQDALIHVMRHGKKLGYQGRYRYLDPIVRKVFDFPFISRVVMGSDWTKLDAGQKHELQEALAKLSVSSFAKEFASYSGQRFVLDSHRSIGGGVLVRYVFHSGNDRIKFDYQMHRDTSGHWKIANVIVDGVSDLALKSGQYRSLFAKKGYTALIAWIDKQIKANAA